MFEKTTKYAVNALAAGIAASTLYLAVPAWASGSHPPTPTLNPDPMVMAGSYRLFDHPDGALSQGTYGYKYPYGLRMDDLDCCSPVHPDSQSTFSVEQGANTDIMLMWDGTAGGVGTATLSGTIRRNNYDEFWNPIYDEWEVDYTITGITSFADPADGWYATDGSGTLSMGMTSVVLDGKTNGSGQAFVFARDGHRCSTANGSSYGDHQAPCATNAIVGRGWLEQIPGGYAESPNDWLFVAEKKPGTPPPPTGIPEPATLALFGMGMIGLRYVRRRKTATA